MSSIRYQFDRLETTNDYKMNFTFYEGDSMGRVESVRIDGVEVLTGIVVSNVPQRVSVDVPDTTIQDGSILVEILNSLQPVISEISLEQDTI